MLTAPRADPDGLALAHQRYGLRNRAMVDLRRLEDFPVLLVGREFAARAIFDAACRMARFTPNVQFEGSTPHTLAALAEAGHGVAIVPGTLRYASKRVQSLPLQFRGEPVVLPLAIHWDDRPCPATLRIFRPCSLLTSEPTWA